MSNPSSPHNVFLSLVRVIQRPYEVHQLANELRQVYPILKKNFQDFEIIIVSNVQAIDFKNYLEVLTPDEKANIYIIKLSACVDYNNAIVAGFDRANGDYTLYLEGHFWNQPHLILNLYLKTQENYDLVYLRSTGQPSAKFKPLHRLFYTIMRQYSNLKIDEQAHHSRIISRRALNSLLKLRENLRFMKAIYSILGYRTGALEVEEEVEQSHLNFSEQFQTSLVAITSFTTFLRTLLLWIFIFSIGFLLLVVFNAVKVRLTNVDIFGTYHEALSGWAFLVVIMSIFFAITCLNLYIMSIYLSNIYFEIKQRPLYIIESIERI